MADPIDYLLGLEKKQESLFEPHSTLPGIQKDPWTKDDVHNALAAAGLTPGVGAIADAVDTAMYLWEGEYGNAAISAAAIMPIIGHLATGKKALKAAKESGEELVTLYRGVPKWERGKMVKGSNYVGGGEYSNFKEALWVTEDINIAKSYAKGETGSVMEFTVPKSWMDKNFIKTMSTQGKVGGIFQKGLPKGFLKKVHGG